MFKILVIGSTGQLAFDLIKVLKTDYEVISSSRDDFDVSNNIAVEKFIKNNKPDIIVNTAAYHKTEECELNPEKSFRVNAIGAYNVAKAAHLISAKVFFFSTDYVFDGSKEYFIESDIPNPLNVYGASKLSGEILTKVANENYYIIRTSWLFGRHQSSKGYNFVSLMLKKAKDGEAIRVVNDQYGSPTYTYDLALKIKELIDKKAPSGIYHITNSGSCSWYKFAKKIFELVNINPDLEAIKSSDRLSNIKRPKYSVLSGVALEKIGLDKLRSWQEALKEFLLDNK